MKKNVSTSESQQSYWKIIKNMVLSPKPIYFLRGRFFGEKKKFPKNFQKKISKIFLGKFFWKNLFYQKCSPSKINRFGRKKFTPPFKKFPQNGLLTFACLTPLQLPQCSGVDWIKLGLYFVFVCHLAFEMEIIG